MCREVAVSELAALVSGVVLVQMWVCDLVMSRLFLPIHQNQEGISVYQALYRKYRPQTFDEVVGQGSITKILKAQLQTGRLSHAYLFTGSRGTGKTSCAKILAKAVNCLNPHDGNPCNVCAACRSIDAGSCMDVLEIDAASNNGVDHVRELRDDAIYTPSQVRRRVYIIDEVHMLSLSAFNALLKIIEEPPEHLIFILATTELHKVPATILSRCQRFSFRRISPEDVALRLQHIATQEHISLEPQAAMVLARMADGALRDGVSLLDQCASAATGPVTAEVVYQCLGLAGEQKAAEMMEAIAEKNARKALTLFDRLYADGKDIGALLDELCALARDLLVLKTAPTAGLSMLSGVSTEQEAQALKDRLSAGELIQILKTLQQTMAGFTRGGKNRMDGELCLIRLCEPALSLEPEALNARLTRLEEAVASGVGLPHVTAAKPVAETEEEERPPLPGDADAPPEFGEPAAASPPEPAANFWADFAGQVRETLGPPVSGFFISSPDAPVQGVLRSDQLELQCQNTFVYDMVNKPEILQKIGRCLCAALGRSIPVLATDLQAKPKANDHLQALLAFGKEHSDIVKIKK